MSKFLSFVVVAGGFTMLLVIMACIVAVFPFVCVVAIVKLITDAVYKCSRCRNRKKTLGAQLFGAYQTEQIRR